MTQQKKLEDYQQKKVPVELNNCEVKQSRLSEKMKQDVVVADESATSRVTLWEEQVGVLEQGRSYILKNFVVRVYQSTKYLDGRSCRNYNNG